MDEASEKVAKLIKRAESQSPAQHDLPFGGVGASGMGHYRCFEGFVTFSRLHPVFYQAKFSAMKFLAPPYGKLAN